MKKTNGVGIFLAILAATLYAINSPFSKLLLDYMPPTPLGVVFYFSTHQATKSNIYCSRSMM
ncbi:MAG: hypothetical protein IKB02_00355 [Clostridia bacterium]|nr:hypothetical protein [Clostridia bacterium]